MEAQIIQYIEQILQRDPLPGEVDTWVTFVNNGNMTLEGVQSAIINSAEAANDVYPVIRAYQAVYGRVPDDDGLDYWVNVYRGVQDLDNPDTPTVNEGMVALLEAWVDPVQTPEFAERFGANPTGLQFVTACYVNVLNREPDQAGLDYWENAFNVIQAQLVAGGMSEADATLETRQIILEQFVNSVEYIERSEFFVETFLDGAGDGTEDYAGSLWDRAPFELAAADVAVAEGDFGSKVVTIDVELDEAPTKDVVLNYTTVAGTATAGNDYVPQTGQITIKAGETKASVQITILGDTLAELDETFDVVFSSPLIVGGSVASTVTINDDESTTRALTPGIDIFEGQNAGGPGKEVFLSSDTELGGNDQIDGGDGEDTLFHTINNASEYAPYNATMTQEWSIADVLGSGGEGLARGYSVVWSGFQTESVEVLAIRNNDEWFYGGGSAWGQDEGPYGAGDDIDYGEDNGGGFAMVDVTDMDGLETVVFYQQNGNTGVRDLQASHIAHDGVHVALIDIEGFHGADGSADYYSGGETPNEYAILEEDNPWTCADEGGLPRQIALTVDTIVDFDTEATRGENEINVLLNEVSMANLWFTQNLDNRDGELAEIEQLNLSLPNEVILPGAEFDGITGEPALINRIWASSTLHTITVTGDDVTELVGGVPDSEYDLMLGIPILATDDWYTSSADVGDPWGLDVGLPGLTTFDASEFNGDLFLALYNAVNMTIRGGSGDDDIFINAEDADSGYLGIHADDVGLLQGTTIDGGEGYNVLWLPMSDNHGYDPNIEGERGFDAVGPGNTLANIDQIIFYGAIGHGSNTYELNVDWLGLEDPARTELVFDGAIGASTVIFDNFDEVINVKFSDIGGFIPGEPPTYAPTLAFVPAGEGDNDTVNITFSDDTRSSSFVTITDDENHGAGLVDIKGTANDESDDEFDGDGTGEGDADDGDVDHEVEVLNIHLGDSDCGIASCLHIGIDSMVELREITVTDDDYLRSVTPAMALFFQWWAEEAHEMKGGVGFQSSEFNNLPNGLSYEQVCDFIELFGLDPWNQANGNGVPLPENFAELQAGDTFVLPQSLAIGTVHGDGTDTPSLALFNASESSANIDMWLGSNGYTDEYGAPLYQLDFDPNGATILTGSGNDRVIDGSGSDHIETGEGCDLILALNGGDDFIDAGGGNDLVVGGQGNDTIFGGEGDDMISGDGYGWLLALLVDDECCIDCSPIIWLLDFFCCIENHCFKDEFQAEIRGVSTEGQGLQTLLLNGDGGHGGAQYNLIDTEGNPGCDATEALWQYFLDQVEGNQELLDTDLGLTLDLCDLADALRTGEIDLSPYSGSITLEFDCENEAVRDFILQVLEAPLQSISGSDIPLSYVLENIAEFVDSMADGGGDDEIHGGAGNDIIHGGSGNDLLFGDEGNDHLYGGDGSDLVDGGAGADMMTGGFYQVQPGTPQVTTLALSGFFGAGYDGDGGSEDGEDADLLGDTYNVTISYQGPGDIVPIDYVLTATADAIDGPNTPEGILQALADQVETTPGLEGFSAEVVGGELVITGPVGGGSFDVALSATDGPAPDHFLPQVTTLTVAAGTYDLGDVVSVTLTNLGVANTLGPVVVNYTVEQPGMSAADVAAGLRAALLANGNVTGNLLVGGSGTTITLTGVHLEDVFTASAVTVADQTNDGMLYTLSQLNEAVLVDGDIISITVNIGGAFAETFSMTYSGSVQETYQAFIDEHADDVYDLIDDGVNNGNTSVPVDGDRIFIDANGDLAIFDAHGVPGDNVIFDIEQTGAGGSTMSQTQIFVTDNEDGAEPTTVGPSSGPDNTQNIIKVVGEGKQVDAGPDGSDGSDIFVAQTDGVLANSWYSQENDGEHVVNQLDHICDFWSSQSPEVGPQIADKLAFRDADGNVVSFGPGSGWYFENHNAANTYEDALQTANSQMANGVTKVVALSYDLGLEGNCDTVFDENENFLVVFADTDGDNLADTAVRLLGRDNVLDDFHHQDITGLLTV